MDLKGEDGLTALEHCSLADSCSCGRELDVWHAKRGVGDHKPWHSVVGGEGDILDEAIVGASRNRLHEMHTSKCKLQVFPDNSQAARR